MTDGPPTDEERREALRRRLYAPDVTATEIAAYRAAQQGTAGEEEVARPPGRRRPPRGPVVLGAVLVAAVVAAVAVGRAAPVPVSTRSPVAPPTSVAPAAGGPPTAVQVVAVPATTRAAFVRALDAGKEAGVLSYFYRNPDALPDQLRTTTRAASSEYIGRGTDTVTLAPSSLAEPGGRMTVVVTLDRAATWEWRAAALEEPDRRFDAAVAGADGAPGSPLSATLTYRAGAPDQLLVLVPDGVRWDVVVDFTD